MSLYTNPPPKFCARLPHHRDRFSEPAYWLVSPILWAIGLCLDKLYVPPRACVVHGSKLSCGEFDRVLGYGWPAVLTYWKYRRASSRRKRSDAVALGHFYDIQRVCHLPGASVGQMAGCLKADCDVRAGHRAAARPQANKTV